jgi:hypothetical protein
MSTINTSNGSPSLDAGRPATSGNGQEASTSMQPENAEFLVEGLSRFRNLQAALALARFACFVVDGSRHRFVEPLGGRADMTVVAWSDTRDLLSYHVRLVNEWASQAGSDVGVEWPDAIWRVTYPLQGFLNAHEFLDRIDTDTLLYTFLHYEGEVYRLYDMTEAELAGEPRQ